MKRKHKILLMVDDPDLKAVMGQELGRFLLSARHKQMAGMIP